MRKRAYNQPISKVVEICPMQLLAGSVKGNAVGGGSSDKDIGDVVIRSRQLRFSDDDWDEE